MMTTVRDLIKDVLQSNPPMEGVVALAAEWFSRGEICQLTRSLCAYVRHLEGMAVQRRFG